MIRFRFLGLVLAALPAAQSPAASQAPPQGVLPRDSIVREAWLAWDRGAYPEALRGYMAALEDAPPARVREVAARTGEVYTVTEVAPDGDRLAVDPEGRFATWEVIREDGTAETRVVDARTGRDRATIPGFGAVPGPGGRIAYLAEGPVPAELDQALAAADRARRAGERREYFTRMREAAWYRMNGLELRVRTVETGEDRAVQVGDILPAAISWTSDGGLLVTGSTADGRAGALLRVREGVGVPLGLPDGFPGEVFAGPPGTAVVEIRDTPVLPTPPGTEIPRRGMDGLAVIREDGEGAFFPGARSPSVAADGSRLSYLRTAGDETELQVVDLSGDLGARTLLVTEDPVAAPAVAPDGGHVAYQQQPLHDWEVFAVPTSGAGEPIQLSNEIQHDRYPHWVDSQTVLAAKGEGRHMRSWLYHLDGRPPLKLFHNNTVRTIAPEYDWEVVPGGRQIFVVSERDGDTVSPERGVYLVDLTRPVTREALMRRLETALAAEEDLRRRGRETFAPIMEQVREATSEISVERIYAYARDLYLMGSKHITQPGNRQAVDYLAATLRSWGYEPELQWFEPRPGIRTANVVVRIPGRIDPELVYVVSSHFDSVERGPGADDNSSGTTALLEVARVLRGRPLPATVELAFFTGEEAGLLGSREYVRRAVEGGRHITGALNNDMLGWANDHRLDNTIRYSNPGIRDVQHAAAILFSDLITYDALYYKSTDAAAYYEAFGDIVGGIGSYPVLGNPHYHQATDRLETIDQRLVREVARTTAASIMLLASAPSRLGNLSIRTGDESTVLRWGAAPESDVREYEVRWHGEDGTEGEMRVPPGAGEFSEARLPPLPPGTTVSVRARNARGHHGWDWARIRVPDSP